MAMVAKLTVSNATQADAANWVAPRDVFGPQLIPSPAPRGPCIVQALTAPTNSPSEWGQIAWAGGEPVPGRPNQRLVNRHQAGNTTVMATIGGSGPQVTIWVVWATVAVQTSGLRPPRAKSWAEGMPFTAGNSCGAFVVQAFSMGENARGQVVAVAELTPKGVGQVISAAGMGKNLRFRRQVTAHDFVDGKRDTGKRPSFPGRRTTRSRSC
jgi:hypothetical protein